MLPFLKGNAFGKERNKGLKVLLILLFLLSVWFSVALAGNLNQNKSGYFISVPITSSDLANYAVDIFDFELPPVEFELIKEVVSQEVYTAVEEEMEQPVPNEEAALGKPPSIQLSLEAIPGQLTEPGGLVDFHLQLVNQSDVPISITGLRDDRLGNIADLGCDVNVGIQPNGTYQCDFQARIEGNGSETFDHILTAEGSDQDGNHYQENLTHILLINDSLPTISLEVASDRSAFYEPGSNITLRIELSNTSQEPVFLVDLENGSGESLSGSGDCNSLSNPYPEPLEIGQTYICHHSVSLSGNAGEQLSLSILANVEDDEGNQEFEISNIAIQVMDAAPTAAIASTSNPAIIDEPGSLVQFSLEVTNTSAEPLLVTKLFNDHFGILSGKGSCQSGNSLPPGEIYSCSFPEFISGNSGDSHQSLFSVWLQDDEGNLASSSASASVSITDVLPSLSLSISPDPTAVPEPGGDVLYSIQVSNTSPEEVTLTSLTDSQFGDLNGRGSCAANQPISPAAVYTCSFTGSAAGNAGDLFQNTTQALIQDDEGNLAAASASASISITDVLPSLSLSVSPDPAAVPEPGRNVLYSIQVSNTSPEEVTLTSLTDSQFGDLNGQGSCAANQSISPAAAYTCSFTGSAAGNAGDLFQNTTQALIQDDEGNLAAASASASISITDVLPSLSLSVSPDPAAVPEPGGDVLYSIQVSNTSPEAVTLTSLTDSQFGDLSIRGCPLGAIASGAQITCSFTAPATGDAGDNFQNTTLALAWDDEGNSAASNVSASITITDVAPSLTLNVEADQAALPEPGGELLYSLQIQNTSPESVQVKSLVSDWSGNLDGLGTCSTGASLVSGDFYTCSFPWTVAGNGNETYLNTVSAVISDNEGNQAAANSTAAIGILDALPTFEVMITPGQSTITAPGGIVDYSAVVENTSNENLFLISLLDDQFGDLDGLGSCLLPQTILPGSVYSCGFTGLVSGSSGEVFTNSLTGHVEDDELNLVSKTSQASVSLTNAELPTINLFVTPSDPIIPEPGGVVTYTITIQNTYDEDLLLTALFDDHLMDLSGTGTCAVPQTIMVSSSYECVYTESVEGNAESIITTTISAEVWYESSSVMKSKQTIIQISDALPSLNVNMQANKAAVTAPGEEAIFSLEIKNTSQEDIVLINLDNDRFGDLNGQGTCSINRTIKPSNIYTCSFTGFVGGEPGDTWTSTVTAEGADDEFNTISASDSNTIEITAPIPVLISGQVRLDIDLDGDLTDPDVGLAGVMIELYDGSCAIGHTCSYTTTDANGIFFFNNILPGAYTLLETDLAGFGSTADSQGGNDNLILLSVESGVDSTGHVFLDTNQTATIQGQVRDDRDGDGDFSDNDPGLSGVTIELPDGNCTLGVNCRATTTDQEGYYFFNNVIAGEYLVIARDLPEYYSTADVDLPNDNQIRISVIRGVDSNGNDFLDAPVPSYCTDPDPGTGFVISTSPSDGQLVPLTTSTITIVYNQAMATSGPGNVLKLDSYNSKIENLTFGGDINILSATYHAPSKTATLQLDTADPDWLPGSQYQWIVKGGLKNACGTKQDIDLIYTFTTISGIGGQVREDEDSDGDLNDGDHGLEGATLELVSADCTPGSCPVSVTDAEGFFQFADLEAGDYTLIQHDLPGFISTADGDGGEPNQIEISLGSSELQTGKDFLDTGACSPPDPINGFVTSTNPTEGQIVSLLTDTIIVTFNQAMATSGGGDVMDIGKYDDKIINLTHGGDIKILSVSYDAFTRTSFLQLDTADPDWLPGSTYQWMIKSGITNTCGVNQGINLQFSFSTMSGIAGQVRFDEDGDGDLGSNDPGISGVILELISSGCSPGSCPTTASGGEGYFLFSDLSEGFYSLIQHDLPGFTSTNDADGGDPSQIEITLGNIEYLPGQDFLDLSNCSPPDPILGFVSGTNPAAGSILVPMTLDTVSIQFNQPMNLDGGGSVLDEGEYDSNLKNLSSGGKLPIIGVDYQESTYLVTLHFDNSDPDWQPGTEYSLEIRSSIKNACKIEQGIDVMIGFQTTSAISGQVRKDLDGDGNLSDLDPGIPSVMIELIDGICTPGENCRKAITNPGGFYIFPDTAPGTYTLTATNLPGYTSTADADGGEFDSIAVLLSPGPPSTGNDFLDFEQP